jgi:hypothetical protein
MAISFAPNFPIDPIEFFKGQREENNKSVMVSSKNCKPSIRNTEDGRKLEDSCLVEPPKPEKLWKETIVRILNDRFLKVTLNSE